MVASPSRSVFINAAGTLPYSATLYYPPALPNYTLGSTNDGTGTIWYLPFIFRRPCTVVKICNENTSAAQSGNKFRVGWFSSTDGKPSTLLQAGAEVTLGAATAINEVTVSQAVVPDTLYFAAVTNSANISCRYLTAGSTIGQATDMGFNGATFATAVAGVFTESFTYGALANAVSPLVNVNTIPFLAVKVTP